MRTLKQLVYGQLMGVKQAYNRVFSGPDGEQVLLDIGRFCAPHQTTHVPGDPDESKLREGRRQVWLFIMGKMKATDRQIELLAAQIAESEQQRNVGRRDDDLREAS